EPDGVTGVVPKVVAHTELLSESQHSQLDLACRDAGRDRIDGARLQREHGLERALLRASRLADDHGPLELALVAVDVRAGSGDEHVALLDAMTFHETMRHRGRPPGDER